MTRDSQQQQLAEAMEVISALKEDLAATHQGFLALTLELEQRVENRTSELRASNSRLQAEIAERKRAEVALLHSKEQLAGANENLERIVTERTARLQDTIAELEHFSYTITHDMRAPLRGVRGFAQILGEEGCELTPDHCTFVNKISNAAERMDALIADALSFSRFARDGFPLESIDAETLLRETIESSPLLQKAQIHMLNPVPRLLANKAGLAQCFSNLLNNAIKFVEPGKTPEVRISVEDKESCARLWFEDNGIGISPEGKKRLFQMFERLTARYEGTGIGLALVKKATERMQGQVGVESEVGRGSRFWLEFRKAEELAHAPDCALSLGAC